MSIDIRESREAYVEKLERVAKAARELDNLVDPMTLNWGVKAYENLHEALKELDGEK